MKHFRSKKKKKKVKKLDFASNGKSNSLIYSFKPSLWLRGEAKRLVGKTSRLPKQTRNEGDLDQTKVVVKMRYGWK